MLNFHDPKNPKVMIFSYLQILGIWSVDVRLTPCVITQEQNTCVCVSGTLFEVTVPKRVEKTVCYVNRGTFMEDPGNLDEISVATLQDSNIGIEITDLDADSDVDLVITDLDLYLSDTEV